MGKYLMTMAPPTVLRWDPRPLSLPEIFTVTHIIWNLGGWQTVEVACGVALRAYRASGLQLAVSS